MVRLVCLVAMALVQLPWAFVAAQDRYDFAIVNGRVLDGMGNPWLDVDIGIRGDRIVALGSLDAGRADRVIDAEGLYVAPGFIDVHSHAADGLARSELSGAIPILAQGVSTVVLNPDGGGPWPLSEQRASYESEGIGVNAALMTGHGSIRRQVMGMEDRPPTDEEMSRMKAMVREAAGEGSFGLSTGLYYAPGSYASTDEVLALAKELGGSGVYSSHIRDEGDYTVGLLAAVDEVIRIAEEAHIAGIVTHMKALGPGNWGKVVPATIRIERARARGVSVWADQYPYQASGTSITGALVPRWAQAGETMPGRPSPLEQRLTSQAERARLRAEMIVNIERRGGPGSLQVSRHRADPSIEGTRLSDLAESRGVAPVDLALSLLEQGGAGLVSFNMSENDLAHIMKKDYTMTCSDGGLVAMGEGKPHPRYYGTFPRKIALYVRERGVVTLPHAIRSMTSLPAAVFGMAARGQVRTGAFADLVVFDLEEMTDLATYNDPHQVSTGVVHMFVNGSLTGPGVRAGAVLSPSE